MPVKTWLERFDLAGPPSQGPHGIDLCPADSSFLKNFELLEIVASSEKPLSFDAITILSGLPKSTVHRLLKQLVSAHLLMLEANGKNFAAGKRLHALSASLCANSKLHRQRHAIIADLVKRIGHTCNFTTLAINEVVYVDRVEAAWPCQIDLPQGSRVPLHCTSSGKLFLSFMPARQRRRLLFRSSLEKFTDSTIVDPLELEEHLKDIRKSAFAIDDGGFIGGMISVAVPVFGRKKKIIGCVAVHANRIELPLKEAFSHLTEIKAAARELGSLYRRLDVASS